MLKTITLPQVILLAACLAAPIAAYKLLGSTEAAGVTYSAGTILMFMLGRNGELPAPVAPAKPDLKVLEGGKSDEE